MKVRAWWKRFHCAWVAAWDAAWRAGGDMHSTQFINSTPVDQWSYPDTRATLPAILEQEGEAAP